MYHDITNYFSRQILFDLSCSLCFWMFSFLFFFFQFMLRFHYFGWHLRQCCLRSLFFFLKFDSIWILIRHSQKHLLFQIGFLNKREKSGSKCNRRWCVLEAKTAGGSDYTLRYACILFEYFMPFLCRTQPISFLFMFYPIASCFF